MAAGTPLVVIAGPTASGKSALAMEVARRYNGAIIAADSRTVYRDMDIGTAKPSQEDMQEVEHYCVDITTPNEPFTAAQFQKCANEAITTVADSGRVPILAGGTGLYIDSIIFNYIFGPPANLLERAKFEAMDLSELITICQQKNIELPHNVKNKRHVIRAIEQGGVNRMRQQSRRPNTLIVGLRPKKDRMKLRVEERARDMLKAGLVHEARVLADRYGWDSEAMKGNAYPVIRRLINREIDEPQALELMVKADLLLIKRQLTWFKRNPHIHWSDNPDELMKQVEQFLAPKSTPQPIHSLLQ